MKVAKINRYTCSDGKVFYGKENENKAKAYQNKIDNDFKQYNRELKIAKIVGCEGVFKDYEEDPAYENIGDAFLNGHFDSEISVEIEALFDDPPCPRDLDGFSNMAEAISQVVGSFGGIDVIKKLCKAVEQEEKS